ncbi:hypothetical protein DXT99_07640 [Pontibacter diazotrophicus]|uniref:Uncharacterized protein n=1 Tax=Pontibacter diazotrophicus TaxID=1400979 RepID=A0A3D8LEN2_9BACT|nr:hypothetical protein [Pontibacter diazotrophicus]RDV15860.1 hypothetical protein DXT99_07640 [Pontibacter diazotrophicus]
MDLILFSCRARIDSFFRQKPKQRGLLLGLGILLAGFYSLMFSYLLQLAEESGRIRQSAEQVLEYANLFLLVIIILRGFFPAYVPKSGIIQRIYPIPPLQKFWTELAVELVSPFYFIALNFLIFLFLMAPAYDFVHLLQSLLVVLTAHVTLRSLQVFVERKIRWTHSYLFMAAVMAAAFVALQVRVPMFRPTSDWLMLVVHVAALGFFITASYFLEHAAADARHKVVNYSSNARRSLGWRLFKNHKMARQMLIFGMVFKVLILAVDAVSYLKKGNHIFDEILSLWIFVGPLVIFSYVFNNVWGFYRNLWLTIERSSGSYKDFIKASLLPLRVPLLMDAVLTFMYVTFFNHESALFIVLMYIASILVLTPLGIIASIVRPIAVKGGMFSFSTKTSYLYNFIAIFLFSMLLLPRIHPLLYLLYPLIIGGVIFALVAVLKEYPAYKHKLFETLYKTEA